VVAVVFNNGAFGNVRRDQMEQFGGRLVGSVLQNPDFVRLAETFGVRGARATSPAALKQALEGALNTGGPWLIEVPVSAEDSPWPILQGR
jgi:acetolactate synthase I/II/III large subunit